MYTVLFLGCGINLVYNQEYKHSKTSGTKCIVRPDSSGSKAGLFPGFIIDTLRCFILFKIPQIFDCLDLFFKKTPTMRMDCFGWLGDSRSPPYPKALNKKHWLTDILLTLTASSLREHFQLVVWYERFVKFPFLKNNKIMKFIVQKVWIKRG